MIAHQVFRLDTGGSRSKGMVVAFAETSELDTAGCMARIVETRDRAAFKALFLAYAPKVKTYLVRHGASPSQAEELAQEALLTVWRKANYYDPARASVAAWLFTIARNLRIDAIRKEQSAIAYALAVPAVEASDRGLARGRERGRRSRGPHPRGRARPASRADGGRPAVLLL